MNGKKARELRQRARTIAHLQGRELKQTEYDIRQHVIVPSEMRQIKKEYNSLKRNGSHLERERNMEH